MRAHQLEAAGITYTRPPELGLCVFTKQRQPIRAMVLAKYIPTSTKRIVRSREEEEKDLLSAMMAAIDQIKGTRALDGVRFELAGGDGVV